MQTTVAQIPSYELYFEKNYLYGNAALDREHLFLAGVLDKLQLAPPDQVFPILTNFFSMLMLHFYSEEYLMKKYNYPDSGLVEHFKHHEMLLKKVLDIIQHYRHHKNGASVACILWEAFVLHVTSDDIVLGQFLDNL